MGLLSRNESGIEGNDMNAMLCSQLKETLRDKWRKCSRSLKHRNVG